MPENQLTTQLENFEQSMQRVMWTERKQLEQLMIEHDLTLPKFLVLVSLVKRNGGCPIGKLAEELFQSYPTMTGIVDRLADDKLVARERAQAKDRRQVVVSLTPQGKQLLQRARTARRVRMRHALEKFTARDRKEFMRLLSAYLHVLEQDAG